MGAEASHQPGDYVEPELPAGTVGVRISVYKLEITGVGFLDKIGAELAGAYHTGLVVADEEWAFGGHDAEGKSGVYCTVPELNPMYIFYQRVVFGELRASPREIAQQIRWVALSDKWQGTKYDLMERNCNHFVSDLCWILLKKRPPKWINDTADRIAKTRRRTRAEAAALDSALSAYRAEHGVPHPLPAPGAEDKASGHRPGDAPGARAYEEAFAKTFDGCVRMLRGRASPDCPEGTDPELWKLQGENSLYAQAAERARTAARAVARAARMAAEARSAQQQEESLLEAWDEAWMHRSAELLRSWREEAVAGKLDADPASEQGLRRDAEVHAALHAAATALCAKVEAEAEERERRAAAADRKEAKA